ncbi:MAG: acetylornithine/succinylornithine family transaminase [Actinomycetota bacterium]|nr:acetylornithine/succinylornithine family transaminase [Actinomycetota bacterium]
MWGIPIRQWLRALKKQIEKLIQSSNLYYNLPQVELAKKLCAVTEFGEKVFFANSGTEAVEGAIKLARKYSADKYSRDRHQIISFYNSFHGRTMGALSATAQSKKQKEFEPLLEGFKYATLNDLDSVKEQINEKTCAIIIEPIQGEGGVNPADKLFFTQLAEICKKKDIVLILDEIQTGIGRTGAMFAYLKYGIVPDILVLAKSLGGGMPIGAIVTDENLAGYFSPGSHGSTFGGNAASCAAGCAVLDYMEQRKLVQRAEKLGKYFMQKLEALKKKNSLIKEVRGEGLMLGMELEQPLATNLVKKGLKEYMIINKVSDYTLRFLPPLVISRKNIDKLIKWLDKNLSEVKDEY